MSGHSKWSTIKHKKALLDARRGKEWSKVARLITVAAKSGGNPADNPRLRLAIEKAKDVNMPKDTIEKAVKKGTGELEGGQLEEIMYEGYGPGGVAFICKVVTDNRNRTGPEIKKIFERCGGNLGAANCVAWMFSSRGVIVIPADSVDEEQLMEVALEAGAEDVACGTVAHQVTCAPEAFAAVRQAIQDAGIPVTSADLTMVASSEVTLELEAAQAILKLMEALEDHDDVEAVYSNCDISDSVMAKLTS